MRASNIFRYKEDSKAQKKVGNSPQVVGDSDFRRLVGNKWLKKVK